MSEGIAHHPAIFGLHALNINRKRLNYSAVALNTGVSFCDLLIHCLNQGFAAFNLILEGHKTIQGNFLGFGRLFQHFIRQLDILDDFLALFFQVFPVLGAGGKAEQQQKAQ